jgi:hypothetical protein
VTKETELPLRLAREICQRLIERRLLSAANLPEALTFLGLAARDLLAGKAGANGELALAGDLTVRLVERGRLGNPSAAANSLAKLTAVLRDVAANIHPAKAEAALKCAVDLALKLLETNAIGPDALGENLRRLAETAAVLLPVPSDPAGRAASGRGPKR